MSDHPKPPTADPAGRELQIDLDEVTAQGAYSNLVLINHNDNEFVLDFAYVQPGAPRARVRSRVISSPKAAEVLVERLGRLAIPVATSGLFGHGTRNLALPYGCVCELDTFEGTLVALEGAVA